MQVIWATHGKATHVRFIGRITAGSRDVLGLIAGQVEAEEPGEIVIDLERVKTMDMAGAEVLQLFCRRLARQRTMLIHAYAWQAEIRAAGLAGFLKDALASRAGILP